MLLKWPKDLGLWVLFIFEIANSRFQPGMHAKQSDLSLSQFFFIIFFLNKQTKKTNMHNMVPLKIKNNNLEKQTKING